MIRVDQGGYVRPEMMLFAVAAVCVMLAAVLYFIRPGGFPAIDEGQPEAAIQTPESLAVKPAVTPRLTAIPAVTMVTATPGPVQWENTQREALEKVEFARRLMAERNLDGAEQVLAELQVIARDFPPVKELASLIRESRARVQQEEKERAAVRPTPRRQVPQVDEREQEILSLVAEAHRDIEAGRLVEANELIKRLERFAGRDERTLTIRAEWDTATAAREEMQKQEKDWNRLLQTAQNAFSAGEYNRAKQVARQVLESDPENREARSILSQVQEAQDRIGRVRNHLDDARRLVNAEKLNDALVKAEAALKIDPANREALALQESIRQRIRVREESRDSQDRKATAVAGMPKVTGLEHKKAVEGKDLEVTATVDDIDRVSELTLYYRGPNQDKFLPAAMLQRRKRYRAIIPREVVNLPEVEFYIMITDTEDNQNRYPGAEEVVKVEVSGRTQPRMKGF